jgi:hypothetical protein
VNCQREAFPAEIECFEDKLVVISVVIGQDYSFGSDWTAVTDHFKMHHL